MLKFQCRGYLLARIVAAQNHEDQAEFISRICIVEGE
jgi:hypothetical protein